MAEVPGGNAEQSSGEKEQAEKAPERGKPLPESYILGDRHRQLYVREVFSNEKTVKLLDDLLLRTQNVQPKEGDENNANAINEAYDSATQRGFTRFAAERGRTDLRGLYTKCRLAMSKEIMGKVLTDQEEEYFYLINDYRAVYPMYVLDEVVRTPAENGGPSAAERQVIDQVMEETALDAQKAFHKEFRWDKTKGLTFKAGDVITLGGERPLVFSKGADGKYAAEGAEKTYTRSELSDLQGAGGLFGTMTHMVTPYDMEQLKKADEE